MKKTLLSLWMTATAFSEQLLLQETIAAKKASGNRSPEIKALWEKGIQTVRDSEWHHEVHSSHRPESA